WHITGRPLAEIAQGSLAAMNAHPLTRALWRPRLLKALEWVALRIVEDPARVPVKFEQWGEMREQGVRIFGKIDRLDRLENGALAIVDYKTGKPPSWKQVDRGFALQLGTLG